MLQHEFDQAIAEPGAAVRLGDDDVEYQRLERVIGDGPHEADQIAGVVGESDADLRPLDAASGLLERTVRGPPLAQIERMKLLDPCPVEYVNDVHRSCRTRFAKGNRASV